MLRLVTLGRLSISEDGAAVSAKTQRSRLLVLAVLAVAGEKGVGRERLQVLLWPEADVEHARKALNQALFALRRDLGSADLVLGNGDLRLNPDVITSDLRAFEAALSAHDFEQAVAVYGGAFLEGAALRTSADADQWIERERMRLQTSWQCALLRAAEAAQARGDPNTAVCHWKQLAVSDPLTAATAVGLMRALSEAGDDAGAVAHARVHAMLVRQELDSDAAPEVMMLAQVFEAQRTARAVVPPVHAPTPLTPDSSTATATPDLVPGLKQASERPNARRRRARAAFGFALASIAVTVGWLRRDHSIFRTTTPATATATVARDPRVAVIVDRPERDGAGTYSPSVLTDAITRRLTESGSATVVALPDTPTTDALLAARQAGARLLIEARGIPRERTTVTLWDPVTREQLWTAALGDGPPDALVERAAVAVAVRLDPRMAQWIRSSSQPTSLDSYEEFARGIAAYVDLEVQAARDHFDAAARDTSFTMALVMSAWARYYMGSDSATSSAIRTLRTRQLAKLDYALTEHLATVLSHDLGAEHTASIAVVAAAPNSEWRYLQAESAMKLGRATETVRLLEAIPPNLGWLNTFPGFWMHQARALHLLAQHERELTVITDARKRFPTNRIVLQMQLIALAALGRIAEIESSIDQALALRQKAIWTDVQPMQQTIVELEAHGHHDAARRLAKRTLAWMSAQPRERQTEWASTIAELMYFSGDVEGARREFEQLLASEPRDAFSLMMLGMICAENGDAARAKEMERRLSSVSDGRFGGTVLIHRAAILASLGEKDSTLRLITDAYRAGYQSRHLIHTKPGFKRLRGYPPFERLIAPVE